MKSLMGLGWWLYPLVEKAAAQGRNRVLELQKRYAGERVRRALYALAAEYTTIAAWSASTHVTSTRRRGT